MCSTCTLFLMCGAFTDRRGGMDFVKKIIIIKNSIRVLAPLQQSDGYFFATRRNLYWLPRVRRCQ